MSDYLKDLQQKPKAKRILKGVHFDFAHPELTYTDWSQGGACSLENDMVLAKSKNKAKQLTPEQLAILEQIGETYTPLEKNLDGVNIEAPEVDKAEGEKQTLEEGNEMSAEILKQLEELKRENAVIKTQAKLADYGFSEEMSEAVAGAIVDLGDNGETVTKAFDALIAEKEEAVTKALEEAKKVEAPESDLQKALDDEKGEGGEPEAPVEKSLVDMIAEYQDAKVK